jgi:uncharacterized membrane protein SirB2
MSYQFYKILHLVGIMLLFLSLGAAIVRARFAATETAVKKWISITHGVSMLVILVAGFGLLAKLQLSLPGWAIAKLGIWLVFGGWIAVINRKQQATALHWLVLAALGLAGTLLALYKPF